MKTPTLEELARLFEGKRIRISRTGCYGGVIFEGKCKGIGNFESSTQPACFDFVMENGTRHIFPVDVLDGKNILWSPEDGGLGRLVLERIIRAFIHPIQDGFLVSCEICRKTEAEYMAIADKAMVPCCKRCQGPAKVSAETLARALSG